MVEWYVVIEVAWGPEGAFRESYYTELEDLGQLSKAIQSAIENVDSWIPEGARVVGVKKIALYRSKSELCQEYDDLDECG